MYYIEAKQRICMHRIIRKLRVLSYLLCCSVAAQALAESPASHSSILAPLAEHSLLLDIAQAGTRLISVGERGHALFSDDGGETWEQVITPTQSTLTAIYFTDEKNGWAVGHDAVILRTQDAGQSWRQVYSAIDEQRPLLDVYFLDKKTGFAIGAYAYFLYTTDGGETWQERIINEEDDFHLNALFEDDIGVLYIAAEAGYVYRSNDRGLTWVSLETPYEGSYFGGLVRDVELLVFGLRGKLFRSLDNVVTWQELETGTEAMLTDVLPSITGQLIFTGNNGRLRRMDDKHHFTPLSVQSKGAIAAAVQLTDNLIITVGENGISRLSLP